MTSNIADFTSDSGENLEDVFQRDVFHPTQEAFAQEDPGSIYGEKPLAPVSEVSRWLRAAISIAGANEQKTLSLIDDVCRYKKNKDTGKITETIDEMQSDSLDEKDSRFAIELAALNEKRQECRTQLEAVQDDRAELLRETVPNNIKNTYQLLNRDGYELQRITVVDFQFRDVAYYLDETVDNIGGEGIEILIKDLGGEIVDDPVDADYAVWDYENRDGDDNDWKPTISHVVDIAYEEIRDEISEIPDNHGKIVGTANLKDSYIRRFNIDTPVTVLGVLDRDNMSDDDEEYEKLLPLIPWYGVVTCTCERKIDAEKRRESPICKHEMFALLKHVNDELVGNDVGKLPQRFKRVVHKQDYKTVMKEIIN